MLELWEDPVQRVKKIVEKLKNDLGL
jgi:hypothetical protein